MIIDHHGGECCGRRHLHGMNGATTASIRGVMQRNSLLNNGANKLTEIVVSEENDDLDELRAEIVAAGFVLVAEWDNCSGSRCYMYLHANDWRAFPNGAAVDIVPPVAPAPPPPPPRPAPAPRVVASTYHNVLAAGRSEAGWQTFDQARDAAPRARSIDRKDVYASGAVRWTQNVNA